MEEEKQAFVLRISPSGVDRVDEALQTDQIIIGWADAPGLLDPSLDWSTFRSVMVKEYYPDQDNLRKAGNAAGHMWRFIREMKEGDYVVVPHGGHFYVAEVIGQAMHDSSKVGDDTAFRRNVRWLNEKRPIPRSIARAALQSRMKTQGTCAYATDLLDEIEDGLRFAAHGEVPTFDRDLHNSLVERTLEEIRSGRIDSYKFEDLVKTVLEGLGAEKVETVPRNLDKGADVLATFIVAGAIQLRLAVQAKHYQADPPVGVQAVEQLLEGMEAESSDLGMVITSGTISDKAYQAAQEYFEKEGKRVELVDGIQLATWIVEHGIVGT